MRGRMLRICAGAVLCLLAWMPWAAAQQVVVEAGTETLILSTLTEALEHLTSLLAPEVRITLLLTGGAPFTFLEPAGIQVNLVQTNKKLVIAGGQGTPDNITPLASPQDVVVTTSLPTPVFTIMGPGEVVFEALTVEGGGSAGISVIGGTARVTLNRCLVRDSRGPGLSFSGSTGVIANTCFSGNADAAIDVSGGAATVVQSTFIDGSGNGITVGGGSAVVMGCLFYRNEGDALSANNKDKLKASFCTSSENGGDSLDLIENPIDVTVNLDAGGGWPGKLDSGIQAPGMETSAAGEYGSFDFERQARIGTPQVGADYVGGGVTDQVWLDTRYFVYDPGPYGAGYGDGRIYVGKGATFRITIVGNLNFVDDYVLLEPQTGSFAVPGRAIPLPLVGEPPNPADPSGVRVGYADYALQTTEVNGLVLDGLATVYLLADGEVFGVNAINTPDRVAARALENSRLLVLDSVPPRLALSPENDASAFLVAATDVYLATPDNGSGAPGDWPPAIVEAPTNRVSLADAGTATGNAGMYLNGPGPLVFTVAAHFDDHPPEGGPSVEVSGFDAGLSALSVADTVAGSLLGPAADIARPYWAGSFFHSKGIDPAGDLVTVNYGVAGPGARQLDVDWTVAGPFALGIPIERALSNDWHIQMQLVAMDRAGNSSPLGGNAIELWWMPLPARAKLTSATRYDGVTASLPSFSWDLARLGESPSNASPCDPVFSYRFWKADAGLDAGTATWTALTPWYLWDRLKSGAPPQPLLEENQNSRMLITVLGADEAGNMQPGGALGDAFTGFAALQSLGIAYDHWVNPGGTGQIETSMTGRFWHTDDDVLIRDFGAGPRIPLPAKNSGVHVEAQFDISIEAAIPAKRSVIWVLSEDGVEKASATITGVEPGQTVVLRLRADAGIVLGDEWSDTPRTREYLFRAYGRYGPDDDVLPPPYADTTPAAISFTVYPLEGADVEGTAGGAGGDAGDEQPFKVFVRGEE
ncbi:MAG: right-handed parallel beta-helix repeat-containing protein [Candidatus Hydrogenedentes bacterium]|nr:right-handed parallel beta-helix repeat-containing protein [Candidatus Hydrogenedentota bacterium]